MERKKKFELPEEGGWTKWMNGRVCNPGGRLLINELYAELTHARQQVSPAAQRNEEMPHS